MGRSRRSTGDSGAEGGWDSRSLTQEAAEEKNFSLLPRDGSCDFGEDGRFLPLS